MSVWNRKHNNPNIAKDTFRRGQEAEKNRQDQDKARQKAKGRAKQRLKDQYFSRGEKRKISGYEREQRAKEYDTAMREDRAERHARTAEHMKRYEANRNGERIFDPNTNVTYGKREYEAKQRKPRMENQNRAALEHHFKDEMYHSNTRDGNVNDDRNKGKVQDWQNAKNMIMDGAGYKQVFDKYGIDPSSQQREEKKEKLPVQTFQAGQAHPNYSWT